MRKKDTNGRSVIQMVNCSEDIGTGAFSHVTKEITDRLLSVTADMVHIFLYSL